MEKDEHLSIQFHEPLEGEGWIYVEFIEDGRNAGIVRLSAAGWENLKDRLLAYHPNGFLRATAV